MKGAFNSIQGNFLYSGYLSKDRTVRYKLYLFFYASILILTDTDFSYTVPKSAIIDYSFPCLNSFSETNIKKIQVLQNSAVGFILKLKYYTPSNILRHESFNKLKLLTVSNRSFELSERYEVGGLRHSVPFVVKLVDEYKAGFESRSFSSALIEQINKYRKLVTITLGTMSKFGFIP
ncbi:hypothetical protein BpHYR1_045180 [Brachionus plicatilis]|uniref:Uncharacterized protein n=1 Tax=Brachionus plicatilis TaxID=10195 RepID=A0A3M7SC41_BRAPC|nr:hypothetical protein BpHYR1_045180 [Brachionus plicatilis]